MVNNDLYKQKKHPQTLPKLSHDYQNSRTFKMCLLNSCETKASYFGQNLDIRIVVENFFISGVHMHNWLVWDLWPGNDRESQKKQACYGP